MSQLAFQNAKDPFEVRAQNTYFIAPGNDAARERLRRLLIASPPDHKHNNMPLPEKPVFPYVHDLKMPTLILTGSADIADNQAVAGALVMAIPGAARVVMPDTGHLLYLEKPEVFSSLVTEFLKSHGFGTTARIHPTNIYPGLVYLLNERRAGKPSMWTRSRLPVLRSTASKPNCAKRRDD